MEAHVWTMRAEDYWQSAGKHKSNIGGSSVISKLSVAELVFINQDDLPLIRGCRNPVLKQTVFFDLWKTASTFSGKSCFSALEDRKSGQIAPVTRHYPQSVKFCKPNWSNLIRYEGGYITFKFLSHSAGIWKCRYEWQQQVIIIRAQSEETAISWLHSLN